MYKLIFLKYIILPTMVCFSPLVLRSKGPPLSPWNSWIGYKISYVSLQKGLSNSPDMNLRIPFQHTAYSMWFWKLCTSLLCTAISSGWVLELPAGPLVAFLPQKFCPSQPPFQFYRQGHWNLEGHTNYAGYCNNLLLSKLPKPHI